MTKTNSQCVNSGKLGYECMALMKPEYGCLQGICPFYKSIEDFEISEKRAQAKCRALGIHFRTRDEVIDEMNGTTRRDLKRLERERKKMKTSKVIQYNSRDNIYVEYMNVADCAKDLDIPIELLEHIIRNKESFRGFRFVIE